MTVSAYRTITLGAPSTVSPQLRWPTAEVDENLDYTLNMSTLTADVSETLASVSWAVSPSGELAAASPSVAGSSVTCWLSGGVAGRDYTVRVEAATSGGHIFERFIGILVEQGPRPFPPDPYAPGFGAALVWRANSVGGLQDDSGNTIKDESGNILFGSGAVGGLTDENGNPLSDNAGNALTGA